MLLLISLILELGISDIRLVFQFGDLFIRLVDAVFPMMTEMPSSSSHRENSINKPYEKVSKLEHEGEYQLNAEANIEK